MKPNKTIVLLINLGSPTALNFRAISNFLIRFLKDKRVIKLPKILWYPILYCIIIPFRIPQLIKRYQQIWLEHTSPLIYFTKQQTKKIQQVFISNQIIIKHAFSYSQPLINDVLLELHNSFNIDRLVVIPLYPQFSSATVMPILDNIGQFYQKRNYMPELNISSTFYNHPLYIDAIVKSINDWWANNSRGQKLIFSYHSIPEKFISQGDVYQVQCVETTKLVVQKLNLNENDYILAFQSRFGSGKWIGPNVVTVLQNMATNNISTIDIICPGFISDCLETLEEVAIVNRKLFLNAGGREYNYIPCINDNPDCINLLENLVKQKMNGNI
jgi:ferrochelatase